MLPLEVNSRFAFSDISHRSRSVAAERLSVYSKGALNPSFSVILSRISRVCGARNTA